MTKIRRLNKTAVLMMQTKKIKQSKSKKLNKN